MQKGLIAVLSFFMETDANMKANYKNKYFVGVTNV